MSQTIKVTLVKSTIGCDPKQRRTVRALGLKKIRQFNELPVNEAVLGMIESVKHLVVVSK